jgi:hypothetical protein
VPARDGFVTESLIRP